MWMPFGLISLMPISLLVFANPNQGVGKQSPNFDTTTLQKFLKAILTQNRILTSVLYSNSNVKKDVPNNVGEGAGISDDDTSISDSALRTYFNSTELLQEDNNLMDRKGSFFIGRNHLVKVMDLGLKWKVSFNIRVNELPKFDKTWANVLHFTKGSNSEIDNIMKLSVRRKGSIGIFGFSFWKQRKEFHFNLGTTYEIVFEQYQQSRRGKRCFFDILIDDDSILNNGIQVKHPTKYRNVHFYASNPWDNTFTPKIGIVTDFVMPKPDTECCKVIILKIDSAYLTSSHAELQKSLVGKYFFKNTKKTRGVWIKDDGKSALWYYPDFKEWMGGNIVYLGTKYRGISSMQTSVSCPTHSVHRWHYWNGSTWKKDLKPHIHLYCQENFVDYNKEKANCQWSPWGQWTSCSRSCGNGQKQRRRTIVKYEKYGGKKCSGSKREKGSCNNHIVCKKFFHFCVNKWCYQKGTRQQYTKCKSVSKDGKTCYLPEIRYGSTVGGRPVKYPSTDNILQWCKQLFPSSTRGTATYSNSRKLNIGKGPVYWYNAGDENGYHWCDWAGDGHKWKDSTLDYSLSSSCNRATLRGCIMTSVTCQIK